ncbi:hypothetical protein PR048_002793 [Dryococelus australis]|uniref:Uncharacterized protein n=1 Tax=Dryococelus australis TaxID=614101 RepID=A0ABQ9ILC1_9NEOP|nr:hypothetical protein PR048_002793 [Dryococelus australis]
MAISSSHVCVCSLPDIPVSIPHVGPRWCGGQTTCLTSRRTGFDSRGFSRMGIVPDDGRQIFSGISCSPPLLHSGAAPCSPRFTRIGSQDLDVKSGPNVCFKTSEEPVNGLDYTSFMGLVCEALKHIEKFSSAAPEACIECTYIPTAPNLESCKPHLEMCPREVPFAVILPDTPEELEVDIRVEQAVDDVGERVHNGTSVRRHPLVRPQLLQRDVGETVERTLVVRVLLEQPATKHTPTRMKRTARANLQQCIRPPPTYILCQQAAEPTWNLPQHAVANKIQGPFQSLVKPIREWVRPHQRKRHRPVKFALSLGIALTFTVLEPASILHWLPHSSEDTPSLIRMHPHLPFRNGAISQQQQHVGSPFANQRQVTYSPANRKPFAGCNSQPGTRSVPKA